MSDLSLTPSSWKMSSLGECFSWGSGGTPATDRPEYYDGNIPWLTIGDLTDGTVSTAASSITEEGLRHSSAKLVSPGTILLAMYGSIGRLGIAGSQLATNQAIAFTHPSPVCGKYLFYYLLSNRAALGRLGKGATQLNISQGVIKEFPFVLPPSAEQQRIAEKLDELFSDLDAGVASLKRARANLKRYRAAVLKSAVEGRLTADWRAQHPPTETGAELLARLLHTRRLRWEKAQLAKFEAGGNAPPNGWRDKYAEPASIDDSPRCTLPQGWHWATLDVVLASGLSNGRSVPTAEVGFPVLRLTAIRDGWIDPTASKIGAWVREDAAPFLVQESDFLISRGNGSLRLVGRGALVRDAFDEVAFPDTMIRARFAPGMLPRFVRHMWESPIVRQQIEKLARTSAGIYKVAQSDLEQIAIPVPPVDEQVRIVELLDRMLVSADRSEVEIERSLIRSASLRQSILKRAFTGRLVPQDPSDEPASVLLERIRLARTGAAASRWVAPRGKTTCAGQKSAKPRGRPRKSRV